MRIASVIASHSRCGVRRERENLYVVAIAFTAFSAMFGDCGKFAELSVVRKPS